MDIFHKIGDKARVVGEKAGETAKGVGETAKVVGKKARDVGGKAGETAKVVGERARDVGDLAKGIARKSSELVEVAKLKYDISKLEKEMENNLTALGQLQYRQFRGEDGLAPEIERLLIATTGLDDHILSVQNEVERLQPKPPTCVECQAEVPSGANFCPDCGHKLGQ
ncbi:MAG: zinc ribbon domain-containing protein [Peptococcaceae bacterium]|jgi:hypothetical protein|nr:zinc ribbon domain-containing protein [Peptococcaceae bacterium]